MRRTKTAEIATTRGSSKRWGLWLLLLFSITVMVCVRPAESWAPPAATAAAPKRLWVKRMLLLGVLGSGVLYQCGSNIETAHAGEFRDAANNVRFTFSDDLGLVPKPKPLKTHEYEVLYKSTTIKGLNIGITRDPVRRINNILEFDTPEGLGEKVVQVEQAKDGVYEARVISATQSTHPAVKPAEGQGRNDDNGGVSIYPSYDVEYTVDSSRGQNHYLIKATVFKNKLYVLTAQAKETSFSSGSGSGSGSDGDGASGSGGGGEVERNLREAVDSLELE